MEAVKFDSDFAFSGTIGPLGRKIYYTTAQKMLLDGFTDVYVAIPDNSGQPGGQMAQGMYRGTMVQGRYDKARYDKGVWTGNTLLPGWQTEYWNGNKDLGEERLRMLSGRDRQLSRLWSSKDYNMVVGLDNSAFMMMDCSKKIISTVVNLSNEPMTMSMETLVRHTPTALYFILPIFSLLVFGTTLLVICCCFGEEKKEEDDEEEEEKKEDEDKEKIKSLAIPKNEKGIKGSNKVRPTHNNTPSEHDGLLQNELNKTSPAQNGNNGLQETGNPNNQGSNDGEQFAEIEED